MSYFNKKQKNISQMFYSWPAILILLFISLFLAKGVFNSYQEKSRSKINRVESEFIYNELKETESSILSEIESLKTEKGIEIELRDKFRLVKDGEQMAVIINTEEAVNYEMGDSYDKNIFSKFINFLKDKF
ncbi:MAG: hypothetical protein KAS02_01060 [Candidatus Pacebacteria bacterium]|nr:hypothetical protein [Candidatus Paceibacterota bacterium]